MKDLAQAWNLLWHLALSACAAFALLNELAPPQDLPWKPLDLSLPIGHATAAKVNALELADDASPEEAEAVTGACVDLLQNAGVRVERAADRDDGGFCVVRGAVRITGGELTPLTPGGLVMRCPLAVRYVIWDRQVLQPAAREVFGTEVSRVETYGVYACRRIYGSRDRSERPSEHARANAIDVAAVRLEGGPVVSVVGDWGEAASQDEAADFLRRARDGACRIFGTVLSPDYNQAHRDHLHLNGGPGAFCR
jgi:hypothetical protein